jgi:hypothetical protein
MIRYPINLLLVLLMGKISLPHQFYENNSCSEFMKSILSLATKFQSLNIEDIQTIKKDFS